MILLVQTLICLSYIYEMYKYTFLETVAAVHRLQTIHKAWRNLRSQAVTRLALHRSVQHMCRWCDGTVHLCSSSMLQQIQHQLKPVFKMHT